MHQTCAVVFMASVSASSVGQPCPQGANQVSGIGFMASPRRLAVLIQQPSRSGLLGRPSHDGSSHQPWAMRRRVTQHPPWQRFRARASLSSANMRPWRRPDEYNTRASIRGYTGSSTAPASTRRPATIRCPAAVPDRSPPRSLAVGRSLLGLERTHTPAVRLATGLAS